MGSHAHAAETFEPLPGPGADAPLTTPPAGPRRIRGRRGWHRLRRVGWAALTGLAGGALVAWSQAGDALPPALRLPQPAHAVAAQDWFVPLVIVALGLLALWRLSAWVMPLLMAGLLLGGAVPLLLEGQTRPPLDLLLTAPVIAALSLPLLAVVLNRTLLRRLRLTGGLADWREAGLLLLLLAGLAAPALAGLFAWGVLKVGGLADGDAVAAALALGAASALALMSMGTALQASSQRPRRGGRWPARALAVGAIAAQAGVGGTPDAAAALLVPHLLLSLHALQASPRHNALLGVTLLALWALCMPATPASCIAGAALALLPLTLIALSQHQIRDRDGWRTALDALGLALAEWRLPEGRRHASTRWLALTTLPGSPTGSGPLDWVRHVHPRDREAVRRALRELLDHGDSERACITLRLAADGGDWRWHELQAHAPHRDRQGRARSLIATLADISWRHTAQERERMSATLFEQSGEGLAVVDTQWRVVEVNPAYCDILHARREALIGRLAVPLSAANLQRSGHAKSELQAHLNAGQTWRGQLHATLDDGGHHIFDARLSPVAEPGGMGPRWRLLCLTDLGEQLRQQDALHRSRRFDTATGLPNRDEFVRLLQQAMAAALRDGFKLVVCVIDLDDFGRINAEHGQLVADAVLLQLSGRLQATLRGARGGAMADTADQLARLHGDEFAVLIRVQRLEEAQRAVERLLGVLTLPMAVRESQVGKGMALEMGASVGATLYPLDDVAPETLLRHAGHALVRAKHAGRGGIQFHDPTINQRDEAGLIAVARLQLALDSNELLLHYQPQIDLRSGRVVGVEALLRWQHPERGLLAPAHFLPLVESTGLAVQIGDWVIEQSLAQAGAWANAGVNGGRGLPVSVNVGARQLCRHDFPQRLHELLQRQRPEVARLLHLDVLEADALNEPVATQALIQRCLALGVRVALDDFGAAYLRLAALKRLPVDTLKLDRSYVQGMLGDAQDLSLVEGVIALARDMGCGVLAKGVESRAHARELLRLDCRLGQGNGIAAAMHPIALPGWLEAFGNSDWSSRLESPTQTPL